MSRGEWWVMLSFEFIYWTVAHIANFFRVFHETVATSATSLVPSELNIARRESSSLDVSLLIPRLEPSVSTLSVFVEETWSLELSVWKLETLPGLLSLLPRRLVSLESSTTPPTTNWSVPIHLSRVALSKLTLPPLDNGMNLTMLSLLAARTER